MSSNMEFIFCVAERYFISVFQDFFAGYAMKRSFILMAEESSIAGAEVSNNPADIGLVTNFGVLGRHQAGLRRSGEINVNVYC